MNKYKYLQKIYFLIVILVSGSALLLNALHYGYKKNIPIAKKALSSIFGGQYGWDVAFLSLGSLIVLIISLIVTIIVLIVVNYCEKRDKKTFERKKLTLVFFIQVVILTLSVIFFF